MKKILSLMFVLFVVSLLCASAFADTCPFCAGSNYTVETTKEPTCSSPGEKKGTCSDCHATGTTPIPADPTAHRWGDYTTIKEATCTVTGEEERSCLLCGKKDPTKKTIAVNANAHLWDAGTVTTAPTYSSEGVLTKKCQYDPSHIQTEAIGRLKYVEGVSINPKTLTMVIGDASATLGVSITPADAYDKSVEWVSSNTSVATVNSSGIVTPLSAGTTNIRAAAKDNHGAVYDICTVTVKDKSSDPDPVDPKPDPLPPGPDPVPKPPYPYKEFKITYHPGVYGAGSAVTDTAYPGIGWLRGTTFTRPGYIQAGWSWDPYGKEFNAALNAPMPMLYENITVYPYWEPIKGPLVLTVGYSGSGAIQVNGRYVYNGESFTIRPGESLTFGFYPASGNYVYSVLLAGRYREYPGYGFTVSYDMMQNRNQTLAVRFESVYTRPKTGDDSNIALWAALGICSAVCLGVLLIAKKKKK